LDTEAAGGIERPSQLRNVVCYPSPTALIQVDEHLLSRPPASLCKSGRNRFGSCSGW